MNFNPPKIPGGVEQPMHVSLQNVLLVVTGTDRLTGHPMVSPSSDHYAPCCFQAWSEDSGRVNFISGILAIEAQEYASISIIIF